jgi:hypothetical protein
MEGEGALMMREKAVLCVLLNNHFQEKIMAHEAKARAGVDQDAVKYGKHSILIGICICAIAARLWDTHPIALRQ